ncbi:enoyl-CoA hydratase/isomerase family protein [Rhodococcus opacus]|uniref:enoyl-CoA hydratase/isomerase family protein n=1 Tax=Rhodococcus opacus TaxID=37919 RepID=UPI001C495E72|nr:enoyl-CoA hydratase-related protein [Rhodococcus opacus]MBV6756680.1 enoyl-CoA hydratase/isomerase family protein [Rhodococcus opacus]
MPDLDTAVTVDRDGAVASLTINRPRAHNALNAAVLSELNSAIASLDSDRSVRAIVITGSGDRAFSAGADLDELAGLDAGAAQDVLAAGQQVMYDIEHCHTPVIAAVNGLALGGGFELVLSTTFPVLSTTAQLGLPESGLGLIPGYGGTQRLPRAIGSAAAAHVMLTGIRLEADRAYELGLTPVPPVEPDALLTTTLELAANIARRGPRAHAAILQALRASAPNRHDLALETSLAAIATGSPEAAEGIVAFKERREPKFATPGGDF